MADIPLRSGLDDKPSLVAGALSLWRSVDAVQRVAIVTAFALLAAAIAAPLIAPHGPLDQSLLSRLSPPDRKSVV